MDIKSGVRLIKTVYATRELNKNSVCYTRDQTIDENINCP